MDPVSALLGRAHPVMPVITVEQGDDVRTLADCLEASGVTTLEITLRTGFGLQAIRDIKQHAPGLTVGAGTVMNPVQVRAVVDAGGEFLVSPGFSDAVLAEARKLAIPYLPGCATATEMMTIRDSGLSCAKLFPAEIVGGVALLQAVAPVMADLKFCPTGGIDATNAARYLALDNVVCVGGSWICPAAAIRAGDWSQITRLAGALITG